MKICWTDKLVGNKFIQGIVEESIQEDLFFATEETKIWMLLVVVRVNYSTVAFLNFPFPLPIALNDSCPTDAQFHFLFTLTHLVPFYKLNKWLFSFPNFLSSLIKAPAIQFTHFVRTAGKAPKERDKSSSDFFPLNQTTVALQPL